MCIICVELDKNNLSPWEAKRNLSEMIENIGAEHARQVENRISDLIFEEINLNYGETIRQDLNYCEFCDYYLCNCH